MTRAMNLAGFEVGVDKPLFLIAGPDSLESKQLAVDIAGHVAEICRELGIGYIFKGSFDKANRSSHASYRGPGMDAGLETLAAVKREIGVPVTTDVHLEAQVAPVATVVDLLQTPAFLCRQTDFIQAVAASGVPVNIKKGQFLSPAEMQGVVAKAREVGGKDILVCERGFSFGYNNLVVDMRGLAMMRATHCPVVFDATHSVQLPGGLGASSGGAREHIPVLARAAVGVGVSGLFMETHPDPDHALCDGPNSWPLAHMRGLLETLVELDTVVKSHGYMEYSLSDG
ncbi:MAG: 3-deoxy-8-phosphooctulonate synthase [Salinisphaera sp.]|jgi:2-dehydro-3-deoxyphosphooctonate aldolase (KDO 8-P synthase)|nr:3-deoxy-8-phosphooctulonate synthase [Salinisphaera sp.]